MLTFYGNANVYRRDKQVFWLTNALGWLHIWLFLSPPPVPPLVKQPQNNCLAQGFSKSYESLHGLVKAATVIAIIVLLHNYVQHREGKCFSNLSVSLYSSMECLGSLQPPLSGHPWASKVLWKKWKKPHFYWGIGSIHVMIKKTTECHWD